jgi:hypothetical protein
MRVVVCLLVCLTAAVQVEAATRTVCASGCQYTKLQTAIDAAVAGDVILLRAGETYVGNYTLRVKPGAATAFITIKSDAPPASVPAAGVRLIPEGKPHANTMRRALARLVGQGGTWKNSPLLTIPPGAHHYRLELLEIDGSANLGYGTLVSIGNNDSSQVTVTAAPHSIVFDRVWIHGHPTKGQRRGIAVNARALDVFNSYIDDIFSVSDSQAIAVFNAPGPMRFINNYLEATGENILFGGSDPRTPGLVPSDVEIRGNHFYKDPAWRSPVLAAPSRPALTPHSGGTLAAGTHYFKVVALLMSYGANVASGGSVEASVTVGAGGAVKVSWPAVANAEKYRVYRGTAANAQTVYLEAAPGATSMTYTGSGEKAGTPKLTGTRWTSKNLLEMKTGQRITVDGNLFENNWSGFQNGYAVLFTPKNQEHTAPWTTVRDIVFTNNVLRHTANGINISGSDWRSITQQAQNFRISNNVFDDVSAVYGGKGAFLLIAGGPKNIAIDHNTLIHDGPVVEVEGPGIPGFVYTNNYSRHNRYGFKGKSRAVGTDTLNAYFPGWVFRGNVVAGANTGSYPIGNFFPLAASFIDSFINLALGNFTLSLSNPYRGKATDGTDIGVNVLKLQPASAAAIGATPMLTVGVPALTIDTAPTSSPPIAAPDEALPNVDDGSVAAPPLLPAGWQSDDVGRVSREGSATHAAGTYTVNGSGADIWGTADALHFTWRTLSDDGEIVARVAGLTGIDPWTKAGVMIRQTLDAGSAQAMMLLSAGKGVHFQRRTVTGASSISTSAGAGVTSRWLKLKRVGQVITASRSADGVTWAVVGRDSLSIVGSAYVGLAVTSHDDGTLATGTFDHVTVR